MTELKLNETPVRTSRNFNINNIKIKDVSLLDKVKKFANITISGIDETVYLENEISDFKLKYGTGKVLEDEITKKANHKLRIVIKSGKCSNIVLSNEFNKDNLNLIDCIEVIANEGSTANIIIKYKSLDDLKYYHNGIIKTVANKAASLNISIVNLLNVNSNNFISIDNTVEENANVNYSIIEFGGKNSVTNYYSNLVRRFISKSC